jgi:hypothetical protein
MLQSNRGRDFIRRQESVELNPPHPASNVRTVIVGLPLILCDSKMLASVSFVGALTSIALRHVFLGISRRAAAR